MSILLFPGQGSKSSLVNYENPIARHYIDKSASYLGYNILELTPEQLQDNTYSQVDMFIRSIILAEIYIAENHSVDLRRSSVEFVAGHSLGQYPACVIAGGLDFDFGLSLVKKRGAYMSECAKANPGAMLACIAENVSEQITPMLRDFSKLYAANYNSDNQLVVSGDADQITEFMVKCKENGIRAIKLPVQGAFHSPFMNEANDHMNILVKNCEFRDCEIGFVSNKTGKILRSKLEFQEEFMDQVVSPVYWGNMCETIAAIIQQDGLSVFEIGSGNTLLKLLQQQSKLVDK